MNIKTGFIGVAVLSILGVIVYFVIQNHTKTIINPTHSHVPTSEVQKPACCVNKPIRGMSKVVKNPL